MKLITFASFKGGAGKSTALMATAGSLAAQGKKLALFEADENEPLKAWRENGFEQGTWDENCRIFHATDLATFEKAYETAEIDGFDIALTDTQGGGSELNNTIILSSDLVVIPTALTQIDLDAALNSYEYVVEVFEENNGVAADVPAAILLQRHPTGRLSVAEKAALDVLQSLPQFEVKMHARNAFADIKAIGMLHLYTEKLAQNPMKRISSNHMRTAAAEAKALADDLLASLMEAA